ncbi:MAG: aldo/keto reductase [Nitrososphaeraceae archaeon]|nr:aldo/keto reductase [Nitrososphaeraceae archaeon]
MLSKALTKWVIQPLDLLQFHWWEYNNPYYMDALKHLSDLRDKGIIKHLGLTNFDTECMQIMVDSDIRFVSNHVQYSIIDRRINPSLFDGRVNKNELH